LSAYEHLVVLAERELALVRAGRLTELPDLHARRAQVVATLPARPPEAARPSLERAAELQAQIGAALEAARDAAGRELGRLRRGRGAVRAYGHVGHERIRSADRRA
jgi:hypothetical protein